MFRQFTEADIAVIAEAVHNGGLEHYLKCLEHVESDELFFFEDDVSGSHNFYVTRLAEVGDRQALWFLLDLETFELTRPSLLGKRKESLVIAIKSADAIQCLLNSLTSRKLASVSTVPRPLEKPTFNDNFL